VIDSCTRTSDRNGVISVVGRPNSNRPVQRRASAEPKIPQARGLRHRACRRAAHYVTLGAGSTPLVVVNGGPGFDHGVISGSPAWRYLRAEASGVLRSARHRPVELHEAIARYGRRLGYATLSSFREHLRSRRSTSWDPPGVDISCRHTRRSIPSAYRTWSWSMRSANWRTTSIYSTRFP